MSSLDLNLNVTLQNQELHEPIDPRPLRYLPSPIKHNDANQQLVSPVTSQQMPNHKEKAVGFQSKSSNFRKSSLLSKSERSDHSINQIEPFQSDSFKSPKLDASAIPQEDLNNFYLSTLTPTKFTKPLSSVAVSPSHAFFVKQQQQKCCTCKKTQCLKLYCECFASGEYCQGCNCVDCLNNKENDQKRFIAIESILDKNPEAFNAKIQNNPENNEKITKVSIGCTCKKSSCLRKYCECFTSKIPCSEKCKCLDCKNPFGIKENELENLDLQIRFVKKIKKDNYGSITEMLLLNTKTMNS